jgi:hypothetical protein
VVSSGIPYIIRDTAGEAEPLSRRSLGAADKPTGSTFTEAWLQALIQQHPSLLPAGDIEPQYSRLIPVCTELPLASGYADNLFITPGGKLAVVETKLWRNPEARRKVVAQILDYAKDLAALSVEGLENAVARALRVARFRLFDLVANEEDAPDEATFHDRIARDLRLGRFLLLVVGDGIHEGAAELISHLNEAMSLEHTLAAIEIKVWEATSGELIIVPSIPMKTETIIRGVIRVDDGTPGRVRIEPLPSAAPSSGRQSAASMSEREFIETILGQQPGGVAAFEVFWSKAEARGLEFVMRRQLMIQGRLPDSSTVSLCLIMSDGRFDTTYANAGPQAWGMIDVAHAFHARLAALIPGGRVKQTPKASGWYVADEAGRWPMLGTMLAQPDAWLDAFDTFLAELALRRDGLGA